MVHVVKTICFDPPTLKALEKLAEKQRKSQSHIIRELVRREAERREIQTEEGGNEE